MDGLRIAGLLLIAYLLGAIPFGYLAGRLRGVDIRTVGSHNIGATNVLRTQGRWPAVLTLLLDSGKGAAGVGMAGVAAPGVSWLPAAAALAAVLGHCYPAFLGFRGGKGVATALGAYLVVSPAAAVGALAVFGAAVLWTRRVSAGSVLAAAAYPLLAWAFQSVSLGLASVPTSGVIVWRHRENLLRIRRGTEPRLGERRRGEGA